MPETRFNRKTNYRQLRILFVITTEGIKTEPEYFYFLVKKLNSQQINIKLESLSSKKHSPKEVLKTMERWLKNNNLRDKDEAWLVIDRDNWEENEIKELYQWSKKQENYDLAVSNPCFEYWLLLHFEDGKGINIHGKCKDSLNKYLPNYNKADLYTKKLENKIQDAINHAKQKDIPPCQDYPKIHGTTIYRLVEKLITINN